MKKIVVYVVFALFFLASCEKETTYPVTYRITNSDSGFNVNYRDADGALQSEKVTTQSAEDVWSYSFNALEGDIVFVSAIYKDINSAIRIQVYIDGKVYKEGSSTGDTTKYLTVSGTVPY
jgi:hypothetical protein